MRAFALLALAAPITVRALPVESWVDRPLDLSQPWRYHRAEAFYIQHLCHSAYVKTIAAHTQSVHAKLAELFAEHEVEFPLQIRLYRDAAEYRRTFRFSKYRDGHYDPDRNVVVAYCGVAPAVFAEQLTLFWLKNAELRWWQRHLLAELLPHFDRSDRIPMVLKSSSKERVPLITVLLSDHPLAEAEKNALVDLVKYLATKNKLRDFLLRLYAERHADDTGLELLEELVPGFVQVLLRYQENSFFGNNNTLRKLEK